MAKVFAVNDYVQGGSGKVGTVVSIDADGDPKVRYVGEAASEQKFARDFSIVGRSCRRSFDTSGHGGGVMVYCGKFAGRHNYANGHCSSCDGYCGPNNGCQCAYCERVQMDMPKNSDGCTVIAAFDSFHTNTQRFYCGRNVGQRGYYRPCGNCDGKCGPNNGCQCRACFQLNQTLDVPVPASDICHVCDTSPGMISSAIKKTAVGETQDLRWKAGQTLRVYFYTKLSADLRSEILSLAREWTDYANITIEVTSSVGSADIRIAFDSNKGYSSHIGTNCRDACDKSDATMNLANHDKKVLPRKVRHEFGHALGLYHEHQLTDTKELLIPYDKKKVLDYYEKYMGWNAEKTEFNVLKPTKTAGIHATKTGMDQFSVMLYPVQIDLLSDVSLKSHFNTSENQKLSVADRLHIMRMYPGRRPPGTELTSAGFKCNKCLQAKASYDSDDPRFKYCSNGKCLACFWAREHKYVCTSCKRERCVEYELNSTDTWACLNCDDFKRFWPIF